MVSLNIWGFFEDWHWRMAHLAHLLARAGADAIGLQAVCRNDEDDQIAHVCPPDWAYLRADSPRADGREGVALLTPWRIRGEAAGTLADSDPSRPVIQAWIEIEGRLVPVTVAQAAPTPAELRVRQLTQCMAFLGPGSGVLLGDLGTGPETVRPLARARGITDVLAWSRVPTWPIVPTARLQAAWQARVGTILDAPTPYRRDYVLTRAFRVRAAGSVTAGWEGFPTVSDHALVWADLAYAT